MLNDFFQLDDDGTALVCASLTALENQFSHASELINAKAERINFPKRCKLFDSKTFREVKFNGSQFEEITFKNCKFVDCIFVGCDFYNVEFHDTVFVNCNFYKADFQRVYLDIRLVTFADEYKYSHANVMLGFYQEIFDNYADAHQWKFSLFADVSRRRWDRYQAIYDNKQLKWEAGNKWIKVKKIGYIVSNWVFEKTSVYGYGPLRFLILTLALMLGVTGYIYSEWGSFGFSEALGGPSFTAAFYFVVTIWSTLGYSSIVPSTTFGMLFSSALGLIGLAWTGLFAGILIRRLIR